MESIAKIRRLHHVQGKGFKTIARELKISKNTVKRIIRSDKTASEYQRREEHYRVLEFYKQSLIERLIHDCGEPVRRRRTSRKLYFELQDEGYAGSYEAVNTFAVNWRRQHSQGKSKAFIPLSFAPGEAFQFDWSEEEIEICGAIKRIKVAHIRLCYSRYFLMIAYPNEQLEMVLDAHDQAFKFFGGSCHKGIYDNMKTAVQTILQGKNRQYNPRFVQMCSHHLFEPVACTPASGWEKGQVENQVGTGRCNFFTPLVRVSSFEELNLQLEAWCLSWAEKALHPEQKTRTVFQVFQDERSFLIPYRGCFDSYKILPEVVSPCSLVTFDTNRYSVPVAYVGQPVNVLIYARKIGVQHKGKTIALHERSLHRYAHVYDAWHYVPLLERKPGALRNGAPFKNMALPDPLQAVRQKLSHYSDGDRRFISILLQVEPYGMQAVEQACALALSHGGCNDTVVMNYLKPPLMDNKAEEYPPLLSSSSGEECEVYNHAYLSQEIILGETAYVL